MKRLHIVAAIILNAEKNQVFITKRPDIAHKGGFWEFPGGKVEVGESAEQALIRELYEEIGINSTKLDLFESLNHDSICRGYFLLRNIFYPKQKHYYK